MERKILNQPRLFTTNFYLIDYYDSHTIWSFYNYSSIFLIYDGKEVSHIKHQSIITSYALL